MADKKVNKPKKETKKPIKTKEVKKEAPKKEAGCPASTTCPKPRVLKFLLTVIISAAVSVSIVITTPLWMGKVLSPENQPAFLRKALMPVTNVKVIKTKPLPNDIELLLDAADKNLVKEIANIKTEIMASVKESTDSYNKDINIIKEKVEKTESQSRYIDKNWKNRSMQYKMFLVSFYNMHRKALAGVSYAQELDLMELNLDSDMLIHKDLPWVIAYKNNPPVSLQSLGRKVNKNYSHIIAESIKETNSGLKEKFLLALNTMFKLETPADKLEKGSLKYNLSVFTSATKNNSFCGAMEAGKLLSKQSPWFKSNIMNELEARYKINKQLQIIKKNVEEEVYKDQIENTMKNKSDDDKSKGRYYHKKGKV